jgi:hypothetical protein
MTDPKTTTGSAIVAPAEDTTTYLLDDMALYLAQNTTFIPGQDLFAGLMPDDLEGIMCALFEYEGGPPLYVMGADQSLPAFSQPSLQVIVRSNDGYESSIVAITTVTKALERITNEVVNGTLYYRVARKSDPFLMDRDARRRVYHVCNFEVMRKPS